MKVKNVFEKFVLLCLFGLFAVFNFSCEVGLGAAVDTEPPKVEITSPEADLKIRQQFIMTGTCSDEQGLDRIEVRLKNTNTKTLYPSNKDKIDYFTCTINKEQTAWECLINPLSDNAVIPDGTYEATATAIDKSGRKTTTNKTFVIDNTAPLLIITRPSTKKVGDIFDKSSVDTFGQDFSITGEVADNNNVDLIEVEVYDESDQLKKTIQLSNIPPKIDMSVATWLKDEYNAIYGTEKQGVKYFYCKFKVYDEARMLPSKEDDKGNCSEYYYLNNDIYSDLLSFYKTNELYKIITNTYTKQNVKEFNNLTEEQINAKVKEVKNILESKQTTQGTIALDPENNPYFELNGYQAVTGTLEEKYQLINNVEANKENPFAITNNSPINIDIKVGRDNAPIEKDTLGVRLFEVIEKGGVKVLDLENTIWFVKPLKDAKTEYEQNVRKLFGVNGSNYKISLKLGSSETVQTVEENGITYEYALPKLIIGRTYIVDVVGQDQKQTEILSAEKAKQNYGFFFASSGNAPKVRVTNPETASIYLKKGDNLFVSGTVEAEDYTKIELYLEDQLIEGTESTWISSVNNPSLNLDGTGSGVWSGLKVPAEKFVQTESKEYYLKVKATAGSKESEKDLSIYYDVQGPEIEVTSILPQVTFTGADSIERTNNVNGSFNVAVRISDAFSRVDVEKNKPQINIYNNSTNELLYTSQSDNANKTWTINTKEGNLATVDNIELNIEVVAYDTAGNISKTSDIVYLNQESDKPVIELTNNLVSGLVEGKDYSGNTYPVAGTKNIIMAESALTATITDDDKIKQVSVIIKEPSGTVVSEKIYTQEEITSNPWPLSYTSPSDVGSYKAEILVTDIFDIQSVQKTFWFKIDAGAPTISMIKGTYFGSPNGTITVSGIVNGFGGLKIYNNFDSQNVETGLISGTQPEENKVTFDFEDTFTVTETQEGVYEKTYTVMDANQRTASSTLNYTVDNTAPSISIITLENINGINSSESKFEGTAIDEGTENCISKVSSVYYFMDSKSSEQNYVPNKDDERFTEITTFGKWSFIQQFKEKQDTTLEGLPEGTVTLFAYAKDNAGNTSNIIQKDYKVDLNSPVVDLYINEEKVSNNSSKKLKSTHSVKFKLFDSCQLDTDSPYQIKITKDDVLLENTSYTVTKQNDYYVINISDIQDGTYKYEITAKDWIGKTSTSVTNIIYDTTGPVIEVLSPGVDQIQETSSVTLKGTAEDSNGVSLVTVKDSQNNSLTVKGTTSWSVALENLNEGKSVYKIKATDALGNESTEKEFTINVDKNAPVISNTKFVKETEEITIENNNSVITNKNFNLSGTVSDTNALSSLVLERSNLTQTYQEELVINKTSTKEWSWSKAYALSGENALPDGEWTYTLKVTDVAAKETKQVWQVIVDTQKPVISKPVISFDVALTNGYYNKTNGKIDVSVTDDVSKLSSVSYLVTDERYYPETDTDSSHKKISSAIFDNSLNKTSSGYSKNHSFAEGLNYIYIKAQDNAGNINYYGQDGDVVCRIDTVKPEVTFTNPTNGTMISKAVPLDFELSVTDQDGSGFNVNNTASVTINGNKQTVNIASGKISGFISKEVLSAITNQTTSFSVELKDDAGNTTTKEITLAFDTEAPLVQIVNPAAEVVNGLITFNGSASDNVGLKSIKVYRTKLGTESVDYTENTKEYHLLQEFEGVSCYNWNLGQVDTSKDPYTDGINVEFVVIATDTAGNQTKVVKTLLIDKDADRPIIKFSNLKLQGMTSTSRIWSKQETIYGTVTDDDGVSSLVISNDNGQSWSNNLYKDGAWEYTFISDGEATLLFKVVDNAGTEFVSGQGANNMALSPKLIDTEATPNKFGYKKDGSYSTNADTNIYVVVDTQNPIFRTSYYTKDLNVVNAQLNYPSLSSYWHADILMNNEMFGGPQSKLYLMLIATDKNGIKSITGKYEETSLNVIKTEEITLGTGVDAVSGLINIFEIDTTNGSGWKNLSFTSVDNSNREVKTSYSIQLDNNAPKVKFTSHAQSAQVYGSSTNSVRGTCDDVEELYMKVTNSSAVPSVEDLSTWEKIDEYTSVTAWVVNFAAAFNNTVGSTEYNTQKGTLNAYYDDLFGSGASSASNAESKNMYIWIYGIDALGNKAVPEYLQLIVNPLGDKPTVEVSYPAMDSKVGGTVRVTGMSKVASPDVSVESICVQIDPNYDGTFDENWETALNALLTDKPVDYSVVEVTSGLRGIKIEKSPLSWMLSLNSSQEFNNIDGTNRKIALRVYAISSSKKVSEAALSYFEIDPQAPVIGSTRPLELVQYENGASSGTVVNRRKYESGMWISGQWYLVGSVEDDSGIRDIKLNGQSIINDSTKVSVDTENPPKSKATSNNYKLNLLVGRTSGFGELSYKLYAEEVSESNPKSIEVDLKFNCDNQAPDFTVDLQDEGNVIEQSNGTYTLNGVLDEPSSSQGNQSGFERIGFYFVRGTEGNKKLIDPMVSKGTSGTANEFALSDFVLEDGLYFKSFESCSINADVITLPTSVTQTPEYIRVGGLCRIGKTDYLISKVEDKNITIKGNISSTEETVKFAFAQIVDNLTIESGTTDAYDKNATSLIERDDGDQMVEGVSNSGTKYTWTASINSSLISDGSIEIHFAAFDKAGNYTTKVCKGFVSNNQPRIAGVKFGTDEDGNDTVDEDELNILWSGLYNNAESGIRPGYINKNQKATSISIPEDLQNANAVLKVKGKTLIKPEIIGGNNGLGYTYSVDTYTSTIKDLSTTHSESDNVRTDLNDITITVKDILQNNISDGVHVFNFDIWDKTTGLTYGTDTQKAQIKIKMNVLVRDKTSPVAVINPFYWNSNTDNSLYQNSTANGHIELENDLPQAVFDQISGLYDKDPKVSGIVTIKANVIDNSLLKEVKLKIPGFTTGNDYITIATKDFTTGNWTSTGSLETTGWAFEKVKEEFSQDIGHSLDFMIHWNTSKIINIAQTDVKVEIQAIDRGSATYTNDTISYTSNAASSSSTTQTTESVKTPYYKMDVVPYITQIETPNRVQSGLKNNNIRSASGKYSIRKGTTSDFITIKGFNLNPSNVRVVPESQKVNATTTSGIDVASVNINNTYTSFAITNDISKSGYLEVFTNGIRALNNINNNNSCGTYSLTGSNNTISVEDYKNMPNREPDYYVTKNIRLTDDRYLRIFDMKDTGIKNGYYPTMIMEDDDPVFGYVDLNGVNKKYRNTSVNNNFGFISGCYQTQRGKFSGSTGELIDGNIEYMMGTISADQCELVRDEAGKYIYSSVYNYDDARITVIYNSYAEDHTWRENYYTTRYDGWGPGTGYSGYNGDFAQNGSNNAIALESVNYENGLLIGRYQNIRMIAKGDSTSTNGASFYMSYYDDNSTNKSIIFRTFKIGSSSYNVNTLKDGYSNLADNNENGRIEVGSNASSYQAIGVTSDNIVVIAYYDISASKIKIMYSSSAIDGSSVTPNVSFTESTVDLPEYVGTYLSMKLDSNNGIHISAFDANESDLMYIYLSSYNSTTPTIYRVDQAGSVGKWSCINIHNNKPYIGYVNSTEDGGRDAIKLAIANNEIGSIETGIDDSGYTFTGWEYMTIPAITPPQGGDSKFKQVNIDFDSSGVPVVGYLGSNIEFGKWLSE